MLRNCVQTTPFRLSISSNDNQSIASVDRHIAPSIAIHLDQFHVLSTSSKPDFFVLYVAV